MESIMSKRILATRQGTLFVGIGAAVLAGILLLVYVSRYRNSLSSGSEPLTVIVAKRFIHAGTSGTVIGRQDLFLTTRIRRSQATDGALSDPAYIRGRVAHTLKAWFNVSSLWACVAHIPVLTLSSRSSTVRLLRMKNLSFLCFVSPAGLLLDPEAITRFSSSFKSSWPGVVGASGSVGEADDPDNPEGAVGAINPEAPSTVLLRRRLTRRNDWNFESCSFCCAAMQVSSSLKLAKAQLLLEMRNRD